MSTAMRSEKQLTHALLCNNCNNKKNLDPKQRRAYSQWLVFLSCSFDATQILVWLFIYFVLTYLNKLNIVLWFTHTQSASSALCALKWAPRGRPTRWPSHTFLNFKSCTFIAPCSDPQCLIWFGLWILNWPPNWALHKMDQFKASLNTAASGSLPPPRCVQSSLISFSSFTFYFYPCLQMHKMGRRSIQVRLPSPPLHLLITVNPS